MDARSPLIQGISSLPELARRAVLQGTAGMVLVVVPQGQPDGRGTESSERPGKHREVVERMHGWFASFGKLRIRFERRLGIHQALLSLAATDPLLAIRQPVVWGPLLPMDVEKLDKNTGIPGCFQVTL
jgi:hypothetical protein